MVHVVIGANGFIGAHLAARLVAEGHEVVSVLGSGSRWRLDILEVTAPAFTLDEIPWHSVQTVSFAAGFGTPLPFGPPAAETLGRELELHRRVIASVLEHQIDPLMIVFGSRTQYGSPERLPVFEGDQMRPMSVYALEKQLIEDVYELAHAQAGLRSIRLRVTNPFGPLEWQPNRRHGLVSIFVAQLLKTGVLTVFGEGAETRDYVWIDDLIDLAVGAISSQQDHSSITVNAGSGTATSIAQLAGVALNEVRRAGFEDVRVDHIEAPPGVTAIESGSFVASVDRVRDELGWQAHTPFTSGVRTLVEVDLERIRKAIAETG